MMTSRVWCLVGALAVLMLGSGATAHAHGVDDTADLAIAQTFAGNELTVVIRRVPQVPGPLQVDVIAHVPVRPVSLTVAASRAAGPGVPGGQVRIDRPGTESTTLAVDRPGPWQLDLLAPDGQRATIPFRVLVPRFAPWEPFAYGGFAVAGLLIGSTLLTAAWSRRRWPVLAQTGGVAVALTVALTAALLSSAVPPATPDGAPPTPQANPAGGVGGRPYVNLAMHTEPDPDAGEEFWLRLRLTDGSTGRPVDDLVALHGALSHTVVTSADGRFFRHLHPVRTAAGELGVRLAVDRPGRYLVHTELERADSGAQLGTGSFEVSGTDVHAAPSTAEGGPTIDVTISDDRAGRPTTVEVDVTRDGRPVTDLQPWLGMAGHLIVRDAGGGFFGHVHELGSMTTPVGIVPVPDETVAIHGPLLRFTFTFPAAGRYLAWVQFQRNFEIHTVPIEIEVR